MSLRRPAVSPSRSISAAAVFLGLCFVLGPADAALARRGGELTVKVVDAETGEPLACRMHLMDVAGRPVKSGRLPFWHDHFVFPGEVTLDLKRGNYTFEIERGPEYLEVTGYFTINDNSSDEKTVPLRRIVDMKGEGWWSGDLHIHRPVDDIPLLMEAEDLHVAPVITWWNERNEWKGESPQHRVIELPGQRYYDPLAGEDERGGGAVLFFGLDEPLKLRGADREFPPSMRFIKQAREQSGAWIDVEKPFWWDVPIWLASGQVDSVGLANNHMCRSSMLDNEAWGRPRSKRDYPSPTGNGLWSQDIYYHILNAGLRIPPTAGSASGVLPNPVGYNRVYAYVDGECTYDAWWEAVRAGRVVVTNGPLIRPNVEGHPPGHTFHGAAGEPLELEVGLTLTTRDALRYVEIVKNGKVVVSERVDEWAKKNGRFPPLTFDESGWFLVRVIADV
ncbi:MAG: CehA/McbA family metallohydrolase, partial [Planctomycetales bacterium]|nr:CehA/McbA family metallohydrolase [Planctomycetales bacterium]